VYVGRLPTLTERWQVSTGGGKNLEALVRNNYRVLLSVDENLGRVLELLDREGLDRNTVIVYTSDNGHFLGEHGRSDPDETVNLASRRDQFPRLQELKGKLEQLRRDLGDVDPPGPRPVSQPCHGGT
jgi:membrane-anchored protein YejM (alkaline phosphatase superfamily)